MFIFTNVIYTSIADIIERKLITQVFNFAEYIADLKLTEAELALYGALVLISPGNFKLFVFVFLTILTNIL